MLIKMLKKSILTLLCTILIFVISSFSSVVSSAEESEEDTSFLKIQNINNDEVKVYVFDLGADGDCSLIKFGNTEILIDMGGTEISRSAFVTSYLETDNQVIEKGILSRNYISDGIIEYLIITHGDSDHLVNFYSGVLDEWMNQKYICPKCHKILNTKEGSECSNPDCKEKIQEQYYIETLIDFDFKADSSVKKESYNPTVGNKKINIYDEMYKNAKDQPYGKYTSKRSEYIESGKIKHYLTSSQCCYNQRGISKSELKYSHDKYNSKLKNSSFDLIENDTNGAYFQVYTNPREKKGNKEKMYILYNYFYDHGYENTDSEGNIRVEHLAVNNNLVSVSVCFQTKNNNYLLCGDLSEFDSSNNYKRVYGETKLYENNTKLLKDGVWFYKASHHGSNTSSSTAFVDIIRPAYVAIPTVANGQYNFPSQNVLNSLMKYTDYIGITDKKEDDETNSYYGTLSYIEDINKNSFVAENTNDQSISIFETDWFIKNRGASFYVYNLATDEKFMNLNKTISGSCVYIKIGHIDILVNPGTTDVKFKKNYYIDKIKRLCVDKVLDYVIVSDSAIESFSDLLGNGFNGILMSKDLKIDTLIYHDKTWIKNIKNTKYGDFLKAIEMYGRNINKIIKGSDILKDGEFRLINNSNNKFSASIKFLDNGFYNIDNSEQYCNSLAFLFSVRCGEQKYNYLHLGNNYQSKQLNTIYENYSDILNGNINAIQVPHNGYCNMTAQDEMNIYLLYNKVKSSTGCSLLLNCYAGSQNEEYKPLYPTKEFNLMLTKKDIVYCTDGSSQYVNGDFCQRVYIGNYSNKYDNRIERIATVVAKLNQTNYNDYKDITNMSSFIKQFDVNAKTYKEGQ